MSPTLTLLLGALIVSLTVCCVCSTIQAAQARARNNNNPNFYKEKLKERTLKNVQNKRRQTARDIMLLREELKQAETRLLEESKYEQELQESFRLRLIEDSIPRTQRSDTHLRNRRGRLGDSPNFSEADDQDFKEPITVEIGKEKINTRIRNPYKHPVERGEDIFTLIWKKLKQYHTPVKDHKSDEDFLLSDGKEKRNKPKKLDFLKINVVDRKKNRTKYASDFREETPPTPTELRHIDTHIDTLRVPSYDETSKEDLYFTPRKKKKRKKITDNNSQEESPPLRFSPIFTPLSYIKDKLVTEKNSYEFAKVAPDEIQDKKKGTIGTASASISIEIGDSPIRKKSAEKLAQAPRFMPAVRPLSRAPTSLKPLRKSPKYQRDADNSSLRPQRQSSLTSKEVRRKSTFTNLPILDSPRTKDESLPVSSRQIQTKFNEDLSSYSSLENRPAPLPVSEPQATFERSRANPREAVKIRKEGQFHELDGLDFVTSQRITRETLGKAKSPTHLKKLKPIVRPGDTKKRREGIIYPPSENINRRDGLIYEPSGDIKKRDGLAYPRTSASTKPRKTPRLLQSSKIISSPVPEPGSPESTSPPVEITIKSPRELGIKQSERFDSSSVKVDHLMPPKPMKMKRKLTKKRLNGVKSPSSLLNKRPGTSSSRPGTSSSRRAKIKTTSRPASRGKIGLANEEVDLLTGEPSSPLIPDDATLKIDSLISAATPIPKKAKSKKMRHRKLRGLIDDGNPSQEVEVKRRKLEAEERGLRRTEKIRVKAPSRRDKKKERPKLSRMTSARRKRKPK